MNSSALEIPYAGAITTNHASVILEGADATFTNIDALTSNEGSLTFEGARGFTTPGDFYNSGTLALGSGTVFSVSGSFHQSSSGVLQIEASSGVGQPGKLIGVTPATLSGELRISLAFPPDHAQALEVLSFPSVSGAFDSVEFPSTSGASFQILYSQTNVVLMVTPRSVPVINSVSLTLSNYVFGWSGGAPPYKVQMSHALAPSSWMDISGPIASTNFTIPVTNSISFFRIVSQ
jgi:hypothetical protein